MKKTWFITGCSTGFGRMLADAVVGIGENVIATSRNVEDIADLRPDFEDQILRLPLDVTNDLQIAEAVAAGLDRFGSIDVLVNNAGYGYFATQEEGELEEIRRMFDTNVFGLIAVSRQVIPHMRAKRAGTIINLSSMAGRMATPRGGFYQASKWAVEAISESQYLELSSFGIRVVVIEPGSYVTDFGSRSARRAEAEADGSSPYSEIRKVWIENASSRLFPYRQNPMEVVEAILIAADNDRNFQRIPLGRDAMLITQQRQELGMDRFVEWMRDVYHDGLDVEEDQKID